MTRTEWKDPAHRRAWAMLAALIVLIVTAGYISPQNDFIQFYIASQQFLKRLNPYDTRVYPPAFRFGCPYPPSAFFLTLLPALFKISIALVLWDLTCLLLYMATIYLWGELLFGQRLNLPRFASLAAATITAPCFWSFHYHHMIVPALFFATLAVWLMQARGADLGSGVAAGVMLMKPHLFFLPAVGLFLSSKRRGRFSAGLLLTLAIQILPFLIGYRPIGDLRGILSSPNNLATQVYWSDEQSIASLLFRETYVKAHHTDYVSWNGLYGRLVNARAVRTLNILKGTAFAVGFIAALAIFRKRIRKDPLGSFCWLLALGVWISPYSHSYDALLTTPLLMYALRKYSQTGDLSSVSGGLFFINIGLAYWLVRGTPAQPWWNHLAWCSSVYIGLSIALMSIPPTLNLRSLNRAVTQP